MVVTRWSRADTQNPTVVTVLDGAAQITGENLSLQVAANQSGVVQGTDSFTGQVQAAQRDAFLNTMLAREQPPALPQAVPQAVAQMPGGQDLTQYGSWQQAPQYGTVWYPRVASGWAPYRDGHWAYVAPWGWTWVDNARWGFTPFHYGRWVQVDDRWGWTPGAYAPSDPGYVAEQPEYAAEYAQPAYAPALVTFFDVGAAAAVGVGVGARSRRAAGPGRQHRLVPARAARGVLPAVSG